MIKKILILISVFVCYSNEINSQVYFFKKYTTADGLIQGTVHDITQDSFGRIWFGTAEGLSIYDGFEFQNYQEQDGLNVPVVTSILEFAKGIMLVGTFGNGVNVLYKPPFQKDTLIYKLNEKKYIINNEVSKIKRDPFGNIWFCTRGGLTKWTIENNAIKSINHFTEFGSLGKLEIHDIAFNSDGFIYLGTDKGLVEFSKGNYKIIYSEKAKEYGLIHFVYVDRKNTVWFSSLKTLYFYNDGVVEPFRLRDNNGSFNTNSIIENDDGALLIGVLGKIIIKRGNETKIIDKNSGFGEEGILSLMFDSEGNLWIGSLEGASKLSKSNFRFVNKNNITLNFPKLINSDGKLFIGNSDGLYTIRNFELVREDRFNDYNSMRVLDYLKSGETEWFATDKGVYSQNYKSKLHFSIKDGLPHNFVYSIAKDSDGILWVLTQGGVAYVKNDSGYNFKNKLEKEWKYSDDDCQFILNTMSIRNIVIDDENNKWIGTWAGGLFRIKNDSVYRYTEKDGLMDLRVRGLYLDSQNQIWVGTRFNGVYKFDRKNFVKISTVDGLNSNWVFSICEDKNNNYWFSTAKGVCKFDGRKYLKYGASEGILGGEILASCYYNNMVWFNSWDQIFYFSSEEEDYKSTSPPIYFKDIKLLDNNLPLFHKYDLDKDFDPQKLIHHRQNRDEIEINFGTNTIVFEFAGTSFKGEDKVTYEYMLEGFDKNWIKNTKRNNITYAHLPPGKYDFKVYAINREGTRSESPANFTFTILPPFWQQWWFVLSAIIFFILTVSFINYLIYNYKIRQAIKLERLRTKISTDLHDEVGTGLSSIAIFSELIKRELGKNSSRIGEMFERIENTSRGLIDKMSDIVWAINPENDRLEDAILKLKEFSVKLLESRGAEVKISIPENVYSSSLSMEVRSNLLMIFKEIVTNTAKYSSANTISINLFTRNRNGKEFLCLEVIDDGVGFDSSKATTGNGLKNISRRAKDIKGNLVVDSSIGEGTKVLLEIELE